MPFDGVSSTVQRPTSAREKNKRGVHCKLAQQRKQRRFAFLWQTPSALDLIITAYDLISKRDDWAQDYLVDPANRLCSIGALYVATYRHGITVQHPSFDTAMHALTQQAKVLGWDRFDQVNDNSGHAEVLLAFQSAITVLRGMYAE